MSKSVRKFLMPETSTIKLAMKRMSEVGQKTIFIVNEKDELIGSLSDGDIRKYVLANRNLKNNVMQIANKKPRYLSEKFKTEDAKKIMILYRIGAIPVINKERHVLEVLTWEDILANGKQTKKKNLYIQSVVMAGGKGTRLDPLTKILPKPLVPIGEKPVIEVIMERLHMQGINEFLLMLGHKALMIKSYFKEYDLKYKIEMIEEKMPLGTVGGLALVKSRLKKIFLMTNCDILIDIDVKDLFDFHKKNGNDITIVVSCKNYEIPYGVCEIETGGILKEINEKPSYDLLVSTGMYMLSKSILRLLKAQKHMDMDILINEAKKVGMRIGVFPIDEDSWCDIGQMEEYRRTVDKLTHKAN